jgi:hypothetical protein
MDILITVKAIVPILDRIFSPFQPNNIEYMAVDVMAANNINAITIMQKLIYLPVKIFILSILVATTFLMVFLENSEEIRLTTKNGMKKLKRLIMSMETNALSPVYEGTSTPGTLMLLKAGTSASIIPIYTRQTITMTLTVDS